MPYFSVVIPLYNKETHFKKTLDLVLQQDFSDFELIIVNDGSTDNSVKVVESFSDERIRLFHQKNKGAAAARNFGIEKAKAKYIALIDADDEWKENHLSILKESIEKFPEAALFTTNYSIKYNEDIIKPARFSNFSLPKTAIKIKNYFKHSLADNLVWTSAVCFTKKSFLELGGFNEEYLTGQDLDLWIRYVLSYEIVFHPEITMRYHKGISDSLSKNKYEEIRLQLFTSYLEEEKQNLYFRKYMDFKRYGIALRSKVNGNTITYRRAKNFIDFNNLSSKQKVLLKLPAQLLQHLNSFRELSYKNSFFLKHFK